MRNAIAFVAGPEDRAAGANTTAGVQLGEFRLGRTELIVTVVGLVVIALVALALKYSSLGRQTTERSPTASSWRRPPGSTPIESS